MKKIFFISIEVTFSIFYIFKKKAFLELVDEFSKTPKNAEELENFLDTIKKQTLEDLNNEASSKKVNISIENIRIASITIL